jgi:hypothetical protein
LHPSVAVDTDLPYVEIPGDGPNTGDCRYPYAAGWIHERSTEVSRLWVLVNLRSDRVVDVDTNARSGERSWVSGEPHPQCREAQN